MTNAGKILRLPVEQPITARNMYKEVHIAIEATLELQN